MIVKYQRVLLCTFTLKFFFLTVDSWKVFIKIKLVFDPTFWYLVPYFESTRYFTICTSGYFLPYHHRILSDERLLFLQSEILQWLKIGAVHLIISYGNEGRKYTEVRWIKYLILPKCGTKYKKVKPNTNLI